MIIINFITSTSQINLLQLAAILLILEQLAHRLVLTILVAVLVDILVQLFHLDQSANLSGYRV